MELRDYVNQALRTKSNTISPEYGNRSGADVDIFHGIFGLLTEAVEILNPLKAAMYYRREPDYINLAEELGDACWYLALICSRDPLLLDEWQKQHGSFDGLDAVLNTHSVFEAAASLVTLTSRACENLEQALFLRDEELFMATYRERYQRLLYNLPRVLEYLAHLFNIPMGRIFESNIAKLRKRYPDSFSNECANFRRLTEEREVLNQHLTA